MYPLTHCLLLVANWYCAVCMGGTCYTHPRAEAPGPGSPPYTITVSTEQPATIAGEALTVELEAVKDNRCAAEVQCVWAGTAEVALRVRKAGAAPGAVTLGALAADGAPVPVYGAYRFSLVRLEPGNSMAKPVPQALYRATITVSARGAE